MFETMNALEAKGYTRKPRPGAASMPFLPTGGNADGSAGPPMKRRKNTLEVADEFSSEPGKNYYHTGRKIWNIKADVTI